MDGKGLSDLLSTHVRNSTLDVARHPLTLLIDQPIGLLSFCEIVVPAADLDAVSCVLDELVELQSRMKPWRSDDRDAAAKTHDRSETYKNDAALTPRPGSGRWRERWKPSGRKNQCRTTPPNRNKRRVN